MTPTFDMLSSYLIKYSHSKKDVATNWSLYPNGCLIKLNMYFRKQICFAKENYFSKNENNTEAPLII